MIAITANRPRKGLGVASVCTVISSSLRQSLCGNILFLYHAKPDRNSSFDQDTIESFRVVGGDRIGHRNGGAPGLVVNWSAQLERLVEA